MNLIDICLYFFIALAAISSVGIALVKNLLHAALLLLVCLLALAGIYVLLHAEFLAVAQIMVYAGGIVILIIFGIMLSSRVATKPLGIEGSRLLPGFLVSAGMLFILIYSFSTITFSLTSDSSASQMNTVRNTGFQLMSAYVAPFELAGLLLLISLIGAAVTASFLIKKSSHAR
jgi:NADH:ubiquinone oxidoreductase subunit 6 (subunit J)